MDAVVIAAISELAKMGMQIYISYMRQAGLNEEQINEVFKQARTGMLARNPNDIPD